jgi:hypothetical protein
MSILIPFPRGTGGLDCTVLARMAHDILPADQQIDLINVAFENPRVVKAAKNSAKVLDDGNEVGIGRAGYLAPAVTDGSLTGNSPFESCPDRWTGRKAFQELQTVCSSRCWRFVAVSDHIGIIPLLTDRSMSLTKRLWLTETTLSTSFAHIIPKWIFQ